MACKQYKQQSPMVCEQYKQCSQNIVCKENVMACEQYKTMLSKYRLQNVMACEQHRTVLSETSVCKNINFDMVSRHKNAMMDTKKFYGMWAVQKHMANFVEICLKLEKSLVGTITMIYKNKANLEQVCTL